ncbi:hypothetical protein [Paenibacillus abyssi]|uniref:Uncharacterized protein n=1 Tax=Paenibacillus abyssi TaxID=1340531 RepID=A0A917FIY6_9BACL|nr:hypothetical protein [Paenibacillus abyssi]GGF88015.1 hypothetical protein GCM10010916_01670 [Paenibacillus abyssi]
MKNENLGRRVFTNYERFLESGAKSSMDLFAEETAADLVLQSPNVTHHLTDKGVIERGQHSCLIPLFTTNLSAQMYGASSGKGHKITVSNAHKRAEIVVEYSNANHRKMMASLRARRKTEHDLFYGFRAAALVESIQCDYIAGVHLSRHAETAAGIALMRRLSTEIPDFRKFMRAMGVDLRDDSALRQFSDEGKMREYIQQYHQDSLYFQRRKGLITSKLTLMDTSDNVINLNRAKDPIFTEGAVAHAITKLKLSTSTIMQKLREIRSIG